MSRQRSFVLGLCVLTVVLVVRAVGAPLNGPAPLPAFAEPGISPDGSEIAFVSGGDIWTVPAAGGEARLLVSNAANEPRPVYSPDKTQLAFVSTRTGGGDIYVLTFATGDVTRLTFDDGLEQLDGWSRDGKWIYFFSSAHDLSGGMNDVYRVAADGGTPMPVSADRYANEFFAAASPDGKLLAIIGARQRVGSVVAPRPQPSRRGGDLAARSDAPPTRRRRSARSRNGGAKELWPMWAADGRSLFFVSDRSGAENIWATVGDAADAGRGRSRDFTDGRVLWPSATRRRRRDRLRARLRDLEAGDVDAARRQRCRSLGGARPPGRRSSTCGSPPSFRIWRCRPTARRSRSRRAARSSPLPRRTAATPRA